MKSRPVTYYGKVMLFGEYSVICNSMGLTIPFAHFNGSLGFINDEKYTDLDFAKNSNKTIREFYNSIAALMASGKSEFDYDLELLQFDLKRGLYFESSIPQGYGLGSSGALCAALFEQYGEHSLGHKRFISEKDILKLKKHFSEVESYFHGLSSGIDPLLSFIKHPLWIKGDGNIETVEIPRKKFGDEGGIFLINTGKPGKTEPLVNLFLKKCEEDSYKALVKDTLIPTNNRCVLSLINGEMEEFFKALKSLSEFQLANFLPMIPSKFTRLWQEGVESDEFYLKLCGSGGGGYILGFTEDYEKSYKLFRKKGITPILVYRNS